MSRNSSVSALLDSLMGSSRNLALEAQAALPKETLAWTDASVCKLYLVDGHCPHDLFTNTKFAMPPCTLKHNDSLKDAFLAESPVQRLGVEKNWVSFVEHKLILPCDRRVREGQDRVATQSAGPTAAPGSLTTAAPVNAAALAAELEMKKYADHPDVKAIDAKASDLSKNIAVLSMQIEELKKNSAPPAMPAEAPAATPTSGEPAAADGTVAPPAPAVVPTPPAPVVALPPQVAAFQKLIDGLMGEKVDLDHQRNELIKSLRAAAAASPATAVTPAATPAPSALANALTASSAALQRNMTVCEVCASLQRIDETEERKQDHREGRIHASFALVREKVKELLARHQKLVQDGVITEAQLRTATIPMPGGSDRGAPAAAPYGRAHEAYPGGERQRRPYEWSDARAGYGGGGYQRPPPPQYEYGRPVASDPRFAPGDPRFSGPSRHHRPSRHSRSRSPRGHSRGHHRSRSPRSRHSRSRSRDRSRDRRSSKRSKRSPSRSRSRSRSRSTKRAKEGDKRASRSHSKERKHPKRKHGSRSRSRSKESRKHRSSHRHSSRSRSRSRKAEEKKDAPATVEPPKPESIFADLDATPPAAAP